MTGLSLLAQQAVEPLLERLDPPRRAMVLMAILGLILLGLAMAACVMLGARWVRHLARHRRQRSELGFRKKSFADNKRHGDLPDGTAGETIHVDLSKSDTQSD